MGSCQHGDGTLPLSENQCEVVIIYIYPQGYELFKTKIHTNDSFLLASTCAVIPNEFLWFIKDLIVFSEHLTFWDKSVLSDNDGLS